jgi:ABC-2 type transport system permease protein
MTTRLFLQVISMELRKIMSYRINFWASALLGFFVQLGVVFFVWQSAFRESGKSQIGGYTFGQMVCYYVLVILLGKIVRGVEFGASGISDEIYQGSLTRYLVYPTDVFLFKYAQYLGQLVVPVCQLVFFGGIAYAWFHLSKYMHVSAGSILMCGLSVAMANMLHFLIYWPIESVSFWQDNVWSLAVMTRFVMGLLGGLMLPLSLFPAWSRQILHVLPFGYLYTFPVNVLMGRVTPGDWVAGCAICIAWCTVMAGISYAVWQRGLKQYTGVGI